MVKQSNSIKKKSIKKPSKTTAVKKPVATRKQSKTVNVGGKKPSKTTAVKKPAATRKSSKTVNVGGKKPSKTTAVKKPAATRKSSKTTAVKKPAATRKSSKTTAVKKPAATRKSSKKMVGGKSLPPKLKKLQELKNYVKKKDNKFIDGPALSKIVNNIHKENNENDDDTIKELNKLIDDGSLFKKYQEVKTEIKENTAKRRECKKMENTKTIKKRKRTKTNNDSPDLTV